MTATPPPPPPGWTPPASWPPPVDPSAGGVAAPRAGRFGITRRELRAGLIVVGVLVVVGVLAGFGWLAWSPSRGIALALGPDTLLPDETENFIAADGRFAVLTGAVGLVAGIAAWTWRSVRGPVVALALAVGGFAGSALTAAVGRLLGGGATGAATQRIVTPPLQLRATGLLAVEALVALLVYGVSVTVAGRDDLGVDDLGVDDVRVDGRDDDARRDDPRDVVAPPAP